MPLVQSHWAAEAYSPALSELQRGLDQIPDDAPEMDWVEAYWLVVDADFSSAGFVGRTSEGTRLYLEVHCSDDSPERKVRAEMKVLSESPKFPEVQGMSNDAWSENTTALNLWLADEMRWGGRRVARAASATYQIVL